MPGLLNNLKTYLFTCLSESSVAQLQLVQNAAAHILAGTNRRSHITPILASLHWLPVNFRTNFKTLSISFKARHGLAPSDTAELLMTHAPSHDLRSTSTQLIRTTKHNNLSLISKFNSSQVFRSLTQFNRGCSEPGLLVLSRK